MDGSWAAFGAFEVRGLGDLANNRAEELRHALFLKNVSIEPRRPSGGVVGSTVVRYLKGPNIRYFLSLILR